MPTYEFRCPDGHDFEKFFRSISAAPTEVACPVCGKVAERLLSAGGGLVFKGSGFYITDYGKDGKKAQSPPKAAGDKGASVPEAPATKSDTTSGKPSDAKPAAAANPPAATKPTKGSKASE